MKILKHIPNTITSLNLLCGTLSVIAAFSYDYRTAVLLVITAAILDFFDGFAARLLNAYSEIGKQLDSLADLISFGLAPSILLFQVLSSIEGVPYLLRYTPLLIVIFSALRLAKFNIDERQSENFIGLATPACAMICISLVFVWQVVYPENNMLNSLLNNIYTIPLLSLILSLLLVSEIPMFSMKIKSIKWQGNESRYIFLGINILTAIIVLLSGLNWSVWFLGIFVIYLLMNLILVVFKKRS